MYYRVNGNVIENYNFKGSRLRGDTPSTTSSGDNSWIYVAGIGGGVLVLAIIAYFIIANMNNNGYKASKKNGKVGFKFF